MVVTTIALLLCGALAANGPSAAPVVFPTGTTTTGSGSSAGGCSVGSVCVTADPSVCWSGTDGGIVGGVSTSGPTGGHISGCGSASYFFGTLQPGDTLSAAITSPTGGTLTLTANCGAIGGTQTKSSPAGSAVGLTVACHVPF